jgi:hypothetical protein
MIATGVTHDVILGRDIGPGVVLAALYLHLRLKKGDYEAICPPRHPVKHLWAFHRHGRRDSRRLAPPAKGADHH